MLFTVFRVDNTCEDSSESWWLQTLNKLSVETHTHSVSPKFAPVVDNRSEVSCRLMSDWRGLTNVLSRLPSQICPNSIAAKDGRIREGDRILQVQKQKRTCPNQIVLNSPLKWALFCHTHTLAHMHTHSVRAHSFLMAAHNRETHPCWDCYMWKNAPLAVLLTDSSTSRVPGSGWCCAPVDHLLWDSWEAVAFISCDFRLEILRSSAIDKEVWGWSVG